MTPDGKIHYLTKTLQPESDQTSRATFNLQEIYNTEQHVKQFHKDTVCTIQATGKSREACRPVPKYDLFKSWFKQVEKEKHTSYYDGYE